MPRATGATPQSRSRSVSQCQVGAALLPGAVLRPDAHPVAREPLHVSLVALIHGFRAESAWPALAGAKALRSPEVFRCYIGPAVVEVVQWAVLPSLAVAVRQAMLAPGMP